MKKIIIALSACVLFLNANSQSVKINKADFDNGIPGIYNPSIVANHNISAIDMQEPAEYHSLLNIQPINKATMDKKRILAPGQALIFAVENGVVREDTAHFATLSSEIEQAISRAPQWLQYDLRFKFLEVTSSAYRTKMVNLLNTTPLKYLDEVAYVLTYLPIEVLSYSRLPGDWSYLVEDAARIYTYADSLKYVQLVEYGDTTSGNWYTTTKYRIKQGGNYIWREADKHYYYEYIVMPKIEQEPLAITDNLTSISGYRTWGYFWRDYFWNDYQNAVNTSDTAYRGYGQVNTWGYKIVDAAGNYDTIRIDSIPRLGELMQMPEYLWSENTSIYLFNRPFSASQDALNVLGNWASRCVPQDVTSSEDYRATEPNHIAWKHVGNCHEDALLVVAAARTALIPCIHVADLCDDHVWAAIHDGGDTIWHHFEFFRGGCSANRPYYWGMTNMQPNGNYGWNSSLVQGYQPSGTLFNMSDYYAEGRPCTLNFTITDPDGQPVDGARVNLYATNIQYGASNPYIMSAGYLWTDAQGQISIHAGATKKYYMRIYHPKFGSYPTTSTSVYRLTVNKYGVEYTAEAGKTYSFAYSFPSAATSKRNTVTSSQETFDTDKSMEITLKANNITKGTQAEDSQNSTFYERTNTYSNLSVYIVSEDNIAKFKTNGNAPEAEYNMGYVSEGTFKIPVHTSGKTYVVIANNNNFTNYSEVEYGFLSSTVDSADFTPLAVEDITDNYFNVYPNPANEHITIQTSADDNEVIQLFDITGKMIYSTTVDNHQAHFDVGNLSAGIYLIKCKQYVQKVIKQ